MVLFFVKKQSSLQKRGHFKFKAMDGWFTRWKKQHDITFVILNEEAAETNVKASKIFVTESTLEILKTFPDENIWNVDEIRIYFHALPDSMFVCKDKKNNKRGFKVSKGHAAILECGSMAGEKQPLLFIGHQRLHAALSM